MYGKRDEMCRMILEVICVWPRPKVRLTRPSNASSTASEVTRVEETTDEEDEDEEQLVSWAPNLQ